MVRLAAGGAKLLGFLFPQKAEAKGSQNTKTAAHHISTVGDRYAQRRVKTLTNRCTRKTVGKIVHTQSAQRAAPYIYHLRRAGPNFMGLLWPLKELP